MSLPGYLERKRFAHFFIFFRSNPPGGSLPGDDPLSASLPSPPSTKKVATTEVQVRGEAEVSASPRYENVGPLWKNGNALLFNKDCQWARLIRNKMGAVSLLGQAEVICVWGGGGARRRIEGGRGGGQIGERRRRRLLGGGGVKKKSFQYFLKFCFFCFRPVQGPAARGQ